MKMVLRSRKTKAPLTMGITGMCLLALTYPTQALAPSAAAETHTAPILEAGIPEQQDTRHEFGLKTNEDYILRVQSDPSSTSTDIGVPISTSEHQEMVRRSRLGSAIGQITETASDNSLFGGVRLDQENGGIVVISIVGLADSQSGPAKALGNSLSALVPAGNPVEVEDVDYSESALNSTVENLTKNLRSKVYRDAGVEAIGRYGQSIKVSVPASASADAVKQLTNSFSQPYVMVVRSEHPIDEQSRVHLSGPLYGGEWISVSGGACTAGFSYMKGGSSGTSFYTATAGHCAAPGTSWRQGYYYDGNGFGVGTSRNGRLGSFSRGTTQKCDCQVIGPIAASASTDKVYTSDTALFQYQRTPANTASEFYNGRKVCTSGARYADNNGGAIKCGTIEDVNQSGYFDDNDVTLTNLVRTSQTAMTDGDSGAPVGDGGDFMGIHNGNVGGKQYFSRSTYLAVTTQATPSYK